MSDSQAWWVRCDNVVREAQVPPGEDWECVYLKRDYDAEVKAHAHANALLAEKTIQVEALRQGLARSAAAYDDVCKERDALRMAGVDPRYDAVVLRAERAEADVRKWSAACRISNDETANAQESLRIARNDHREMCERVTALAAENAALKRKVERISPWIEEAETYTPILSRVVLDTGLRATLEELFRAYRALADEQEQACICGRVGPPSPLCYGKCCERRKGERRHGDDCGTLTCGRRKAESDRRGGGA